MMYIQKLILGLLFCGLQICAETESASLPNVLIIGDSISNGYTKPLTEMLKGQATVVHNPGNAQHSAYGLKNLEKWLGNTSWDVIHFNHGLHDLKYVDANGKNTRSKETGHIQIELLEYAKNMEAIVQRLKKTGAALIFATTTPYPENPAGPLREAFQPARYNKVAVRIMKQYDVPVNDLYKFTVNRLKELQQPNNVHFTKQGSAELAKEVKKHILQAISRP